MSLESGNLKFHDMGICRVTGNWDGIGRKWRRRGEWDEMEKLSVGELLQILEVASGENAFMYF